VMLGDFGEVYVVDWGIATRVGTSTEGDLAGTPFYLAPEMVGGTVDAQTDVYLLGGTLHEILTGRPPHQGDTLNAVLYSAFASEPPAFDDDVPSELAALTRSALCRQPGARPATAQAFGDALDDFVRHRGSRALSRTGETLLATLKEAVQGVTPKARNLGEVRRLIAECRFAFRQARSEWAENPNVAPGLEACLRLAARFEIDRRDAEAARALVEELDETHMDGVLTAAVETLDAELQEEAAEHERLQALAHELDPNVEGGARLAASVFLGVMVAAGAIYVSTIETMTKEHSIGLAVSAFVILSLLLAVMWRRVTQNAFNRRVAAWVAVGGMLLVLHRLAALFDPAATVESVIFVDFIIVGGAWAFGSLFIFRWMLPIGMLFAAGVIPAMLYPAYVPVIFSVSNVVAILGFIVGWQKSKSRTPLM
jgi:hypothetical protein